MASTPSFPTQKVGVVGATGAVGAEMIKVCVCVMMDLSMCMYMYACTYLTPCVSKDLMQHPYVYIHIYIHMHISTPTTICPSPLLHTCRRVTASRARVLNSSSSSKRCLAALIYTHTDTHHTAHHTWGQSWAVTARTQHTHM